MKADSHKRDEKEEEHINIFIRPPFAGIKGEQLVKSLVRKMKRFLKPNVKLVITYDTKKVSYFCSNKDTIHDHQRHNIVYKITCPGCGERYIGKTDRCLLIRFNEHGSKVSQPMYQHFMTCSHFKDLYGTLNTVFGDVNSDKPPNDFMINSILHNYEIIDSNRNWSQLLFLEALWIKKENPIINTGIRASRELIIFK